MLDFDLNILDMLAVPAHKESESKPKGESSMKNVISTVILSVAGVGVVVSAMAILPLLGYSFGENTLKGKRSTERVPLERVQKYCFNPIPLFNDSHTCDLWLAKYVDVSMSTEVTAVKEEVSEEDKERVKAYAETNVGGGF